MLTEVYVRVHEWHSKHTKNSLLAKTAQCLRSLRINLQTIEKEISTIFTQEIAFTKHIKRQPEYSMGNLEDGLAPRNLEDDSVGHMVEYLEGEESTDFRRQG
uniref:Uncharacterized protein n=1 Tax=Opuntia streptacantha TaxID=393608 RepID=A0A7C8YEY3_OPUST